MRTFVGFAALILVLQAQRPAQTVVSGLRDTTRSPLGAEPLPVLNAERMWAGGDVLWALASGQNVPDDVRVAAVRALGRVEDPGLVRSLLTLKGISLPALARAIGQSLYGFDPANDPELVGLVAQWMRLATKGATPEERLTATAAVAAPMSHIRYATAGQVEDIAAVLSDLAAQTASSPRLRGAYVEAIRGLEALARVNTRLVRYDEKTVGRLAASIAKSSANDDSPTARLYAFMALTAARALDADSERAALTDDEWAVRRNAMAVLAGAGGSVDDKSRLALIRTGLSDTNPHVRYEAVRAWGRHGAPSEGCDPLLEALRDNDPNVVIEATDLLGGLCKDSEDVTTRLLAEATVPPSAGAWQPQTHAFVALAKRAPEKAAIEMEAFVTHPVWWVRMYAVFAASGAKDVLHVDKLAYDDNDNVREAALGHLRALDADRAQRAILAALGRTDVQLLRTAATMVKEWPADPRHFKPLLAALQRLSQDRRMTARDGRLALLDAIERHAKRDDHTDLVTYLRDYDSKIAERAAELIFHLSGKAMKAEPVPPPHLPTQPFADLRQCASITMSAGRPIRLRMDPGSAPIAVEQFLKLATVDRYYNGLTFHRVVPNFVIQGGSPNANEYSGSRDYMRDEVAASNTRGTVGLSIRGRNTGDAQFYINLIDNPRLDGGYTVFARVFGEDMDAVDRIQEGDVMRSIDLTPCPNIPNR
jgi:cyclophilin family peptidyl-prolyl cis-trans isomerase/HEAT repeat protein